jgi:hypothetical protein
MNATTPSYQSSSYQQHEPFGFSGQLRQTLFMSRSQLDEWVEEQKAVADAAASVHHADISERQSCIDKSATTLLALQLERGLSVGSNKQEEDRDGVKEEVNELRKELSVHSLRIEGTWIILLLDGVVLLL